MFRKCLVCKSSVVPAIDLGYQPLANAYLTNKEMPEKFSYLRVVACNTCGHSQLDEIVSPHVLYQDYKYVSGTTRTLKEHFEDVVECAAFARSTSSDISRSSLPPRVLDIGCNDGSLLEAFKGITKNLQGVDPAENLRAITEERGIPVLVDYWSAETAFKLKGDFNIITALNCLGHSPDPAGFLRGCYRVLEPFGTLLIEMPYIKNTMKILDFGQFYAEHVSYFSVSSMIHLAERERFRIRACVFYPEIHGGTMRYYLDKRTAPHGDSVREAFIEEGNIVEQYHTFNKRLRTMLTELKSKLSELSKEHTIVGYGASAKSSTLFNMKEHISEHIKYVVDDSQIKQGLFCPGSKLEILAPEALLKEGNLVILMTVHNFRKEVMERLRSLGIKGKVLHYTPEIEMEEI